jgi:hypothetical protein
MYSLFSALYVSNQGREGHEGIGLRSVRGNVNKEGNIGKGELVSAYARITV